VPRQSAFDDDVIPGGIESGADGANGFAGQLALDLLAFAVVRVQREGNVFRFIRVVRKKQAEGLDRVLQAGRRR